MSKILGNRQARDRIDWTEEFRRGGDIAPTQARGA